MIGFEECCFFNLLKCAAGFNNGFLTVFLKVWFIEILNFRFTLVKEDFVTYFVPCVLASVHPFYGSCGWINLEELNTHHQPPHFKKNAPAFLAFLCIHKNMPANPQDNAEVRDI